MSSKSQRALKAKRERLAVEPVEDFSDVPDWWRDPWPMPDGFGASEPSVWQQEPRMGAAEGESQ